MKHVVLVTTSYPNNRPGSEAAGSFVEDFAIELSKLARVTVVAAGSDDNIIENGTLTVQYFNTPKLPLSTLKPLNPAHWIPIFSTMRQGLKTLEAVTHNDRPDHIFALWALPSGYWANKIAKKHQVPYSIWALGSDIWSLGRIPIIRNRLRNVLQGAVTCYADGYQLKDQVNKIARIACEFLPSTRILIPTRPKQLSDLPPYRLAFLGRWHRNKGIDLLLDALSLLTEADREKIDEIKIFGGGPLEPVVNQITGRLKSQGMPIKLGGYIGKIQASSLLNWADYLMLPSRIESIPVIFSDAAKLGTPIISTPVGDLPRLHRIYNFGKLATDANPKAYSEAIRSALHTKPEIFSSGLTRARHDFDLHKITKEFLHRSYVD